jgi:Type I restriction modification DNA specificity domain
MELARKDWREFFIEDVFEIKSGKRLTKADMVSGDIPFVGATDSNNGITEFIANKNSSLDENVLGVNYNGSVVYNFYHSYEAVFSDDVKRLCFREIKGNMYSFLFVKALIMQQKSKYEYGYKFNGARMKRQKILLPVTSKGNPDYDFMEKYMRQKEEELLKSLKQKILLKIKNSKQDIQKLNSEIEWREFKLSELFDFVKGDQNNMAGTVTGNVPLVSAKKSDNGYKDFALQTKKLYQGNSLTLNNDGDGGAGISYYQPINYLLDSHVTALYPKNKLNKYALLYISRCITAQREKFGHGYSINNQRLKVFRLMLPVTKQGSPDYWYMENYMKKLESEKLKHYMDYRLKR